MLRGTRRDFLRMGIGGLLAAKLHPLFGQENGRARARNCIVLWMAGGPSHIDTWDPKPGNGPFHSIETDVRGVRLSEHLPRLARQAKSLAIVRSVTSAEADHERATYYLHTGNRPDESLRFPTLGAIASKEWPTPSDVPLFVSMGESYSDAGFLGREHAPFVVNPESATVSLRVPDRLQARIRPRVGLLEEMNKEFSRRSDAAALAADARVQQRALAMLSSRAVRAFDIAQEHPKVRDAYGNHAFGRGCLLARRLVEHGVRFVEVMLDDWDTHRNNFPAVTRLSGALDPAMSALVEDLDARGLLDETLVLWMGEFGRTPVVNRMNGRDHYSRAFSVVLAGGGTARGRAIGQTDATGAEVVQRPVTIPDLYASMFHAFGFDPAKEYVTTGGRPVRLVDNGAVVNGLFA